MSKVTIEQVDNCLARYYGALGKREQYTNDQGLGIFHNCCDENGIEEDDLDNELTGANDASDSLFIDIDENFPIPTNVKIENKEQKDEYIFEILKLCYTQPDKSWDHLKSLFPLFNKELFESIQTKDIEEMRTKYKNQCPSIYNQGMNRDLGLMQILAIGDKHGFDYLQHLVDMYDRDRIRVILKEGKKEWSLASWIKQGNNPHIMALENLIIPRLQNSNTGGSNTIKASELVKAAVHSFGHRVCCRLYFHAKKKIDDQIEPILIYLDSALFHIFNLVQKTEKHVKKRICPFQFDVAIATGQPTESKSDENEENKTEEPDDEDPNPEIDNGAYVDYIGDIKSKLEGNKLKYKYGKFAKKQESDQDNYTLRVFAETFEGLKKQIEEKKNDIYPYRERYVSLIDRRKSKNDINIDDDIYTFQPPKSRYTSNIPDNEVPEWYISASRTCLLPNMEYNEDEAIRKLDKNLDAEEVKEVKADENKNIGVSFHCKGGLLTFSFHVKAKDQIKCYIFWNGQIIRFLPDEIGLVFNDIFNMERKDNQEFMQSDDLKILIKSMNDRLKDTNFDKFAKL